MSDLDKQIRANKLYASRLGWRPSDFAATADWIADWDHIDAATVQAITSFQTTVGITPDGIAGPRTYIKQLDCTIAALTPTRVLKPAGELALTRLKRTWMDHIVDLPPKQSPNYMKCWQTIDDLIRTPRGIDWFWEKPYALNAFQFCGTGPAEGWGAAGIPVAMRRKFFSSTYRLVRWARYEPIDDTPEGKNPRPGLSTVGFGSRRMIIELDAHSKPSDLKFEDGTIPRTGDIMIIGDAESDDGRHITLIESWDPSSQSSQYINTVECNGNGYLPDGTYGHGIVRAQRKIGEWNPGSMSYFARFIIRPALGDLVA